MVLILVFVALKHPHVTLHLWHLMPWYLLGHEMVLAQFLWHIQMIVEPLLVLWIVGCESPRQVSGVGEGGGRGGNCPPTLGHDCTVKFNAVSTAPAPVGRAFGLKYRLADLLQTISRASS